MTSTVLASGIDVRGYDVGRGPTIVMLGPGLDDGTRGRRLAAILGREFRVIRLHRRQYRLDLKRDGGPVEVGQEVADVLAVVRAVGEPVVVYGHSSGGVVALEALAASPSSFAGAVIFEPAAVTELPLAGEDGEVLTRAQAAIAEGKPGKAMAVFMQGSVGLPAWQARLVAAFVAISPRYRRLAPSQIDDLAAMDRLGSRLTTYSRIPVPTLLLGGDRGPAHIARRLDSIARVMPHAERIVMRGRDHGADLKAPALLARIVGDHARKVLGQPDQTG